jgi:phosphoribosylformylglycinamidine synthase
MVQKGYVEVAFKDRKIDSTGAGVLSDISEDLGIKGVSSVSFVDVYEIYGFLKDEDLESFATKVFLDKIAQHYSVNKPLYTDYDWEISVAYHPQVMDNVGEAAKLAIEEYLGRKLKDPENVRYVRKYALRGKISEADVKRICTGMLANELIESFSYRKKGIKEPTQNGDKKII